MIDFNTLKGARLRVIPAPDHLGEGVLLILTMVDTTYDSRRAEVFLTYEEFAQLQERVMPPK